MPDHHLLGANGRRCKNCKRAEATPNRTRCLACQQANHDGYWLAVSEGRCTSCKKVPPLEGKRRCATCTTKMRAYFRRQYATTKARGMCTYCRHHRRMPHDLRCYACHVKALRLEKGKRQRQQAETVLLVAYALVRQAEKEARDVQKLLAV